jgi:AraC family transcriptional regulator
MAIAQWIASRRSGDATLPRSLPKVEAALMSGVSEYGRGHGMRSHVTSQTSVGVAGRAAPAGFREALQVDVTPRPSIRVRSYRTTTSRPTRGPTAAHDTVELTVVSKGTARYRVGGRSWDVRPGEAIVVPNGIDHETALTGAWEATALHVDPSYFGAARFVDARLIERPRLSGGRSMAFAAERIVRECQERRAGFAEAIDALVDLILIEWARQIDREEVDALPRAGIDSRMTRVIELIHARYANPVDVAMLSREAGLSRVHFSREFRRQVGVSPHRYVLDLRVQRAAELLGRRKSITVSEVASEVGFTDLGRFARYFRRKYGVTPTVFQAHQAGS